MALYKDHKDEIKIKKFEGKLPTRSKEEFEDSFYALVLDVETTGLEYKTDTVIELGALLIELGKRPYRFIRVVEEFNALQDPGFEIPAKITEVTGITTEMVKGQKIDMKAVEGMINVSKVIICHNAAFDRNFLRKTFKLSDEKIFACSLTQIDWASKGLLIPGMNLMTLCVNHGFYFEAHRAISDVEATVHLLMQRDKNNQEYFEELLNNSKRPISRYVGKAPFADKDILKNAQFKWNPTEKKWIKDIYDDEYDKFSQELISNGYSGSLELVKKMKPNETFIDG